jgi:hypothetical protein
MNIFEKNEWVQVDIPTSQLHGKRLQIHKVNKETCDFVIDGEILRLYKTGLKSLKYPKVNKELVAVQKSLKAHIKHIQDEINEYSKYSTDMAKGKVDGLEMGLKSLKAILEGQR